MAYNPNIYDPYRSAGAGTPPADQYLTSLNPVLSRRIQTEVSKECDRLDHPGSVLYDEYPDKESLLYLTDQICHRINLNSSPFVSKGLFVPIVNEGETETERMTDQDGTCPHLSSPIYDLVKTVLLHEIRLRRGFC